MESSPQPVKRSIPKHWIVLGLLVVGHAGIGAYLYSNRPKSFSIADFMMEGVLISQPILLAFWAGFASQPFPQRFLWAFLLCILVAFAEELEGLLKTDNNRSGEVMMLFSGLFTVATLLSLIVRRISRWQIKYSTVEDERSDYRPSKLGIRHLLILISITALAVMLLAIKSPQFSVVGFVVGMVGVMLQLLPVLLPVAVIPWFVMAYRPRIVLLIVTTAVIWALCILAGCVIYVFASEIGRFNLFEGFIKPTLFTQLGAGLSILISSIVMRSCGFRLVLVPKASQVVPP